MLLLLTVALVLTGAVLLVAGIVANSLGLIYAAIASAALAAVLLVAVSRVWRRRAVRAAAAGMIEGAGVAGRVGTPAAPVGDSAVLTAASGVPATAGATAVGRPSVDGAGEGPARRQVSPPPKGITAPAAAPASAADLDAGTDDLDDGTEDLDDLDDGTEDLDDLDDGTEELDAPALPIEAYDSLPEPEIIRLLPGLDADELREVRDHEAATDRRNAILGRIEALLGEGRGGTAGASAAPPSVPSAPPAAVGEPIPGYAGMRASQLLPLLPTLDATTLAAVAAAERHGPARTTVLTRIARLQARAAAAPPGDGAVGG